MFSKNVLYLSCQELAVDRIQDGWYQTCNHQMEVRCFEKGDSSQTWLLGNENTSGQEI